MITDNIEPEILLRILKDEDSVEFLRKWTEMREASSARGICQLAKYSHVSEVTEAFKMGTELQGSRPLIWREEAEDVEVELDVSGMVVDCFMGPVTRQTRLSGRAPQTLMQTLRLAAVGNLAFNRAQEATKAIYRFMEQHSGNNVVRPYVPAAIEDVGMLAASARFLTPAEYNIFPEAGVPLPTDVDPDHRLASFIATKKFAFTADNWVECVEIDWIGAERKPVKRPIESTAIRVGQIVEISVSFRTVTAGRGKAFIVHLNSIRILSRSASMVLADLMAEHRASSKQVKALIGSAIPVQPRKRVVEDDLLGEGSGGSVSTKRGRVDDGQHAMEQ
ncbi:hypothetical protein FPV67DRAFT_1700493 [Lyophyllum atratum]|nr:hypothetical protein FPV67DRAFT_1700493 [Lyophyllum atratum]